MKPIPPPQLARLERKEDRIATSYFRLLSGKLTARKIRRALYWMEKRERVRARIKKVAGLYYWMLASWENRDIHRKDYDDMTWAKMQQQGHKPLYRVGDVVAFRVGGYGQVSEVSKEHNGWPVSYAIEAVDGLPRHPTTKVAWHYEGDISQFHMPAHYYRTRGLPPGIHHRYADGSEFMLYYQDRLGPQVIYTLLPDGSASTVIAGHPVELFPADHGEAALIRKAFECPARTFTCRSALAPQAA